MNVCSQIKDSLAHGEFGEWQLHVHSVEHITHYCSDIVAPQVPGENDSPFENSHMGMFYMKQIICSRLNGKGVKLLLPNPHNGRSKHTYPLTTGPGTGLSALKWPGAVV